MSGSSSGNLSEESDTSSLSTVSDSVVSDSSEDSLTDSTDDSSSLFESSTDVSSEIVTDTDSADSSVSDEVSDTLDASEILTGGVAEALLLSGDLTATSVCTLRNLPVDKAVQRFFLIEVENEIYVFTTQRSGSTVYLARCRYSPETKVATCVDSLKLEGFGHGESLEVRVRDEKVYVYITSGANSGNTSYWGTTVCRFVYSNGKKTEEKILTDIQCSTATGEPLHENATSYRINFSLNEESDTFLIYARCDTDYSLKNLSHYFVSYSLSQLDTLLDGASLRLSMKDCTSAYKSYHGKVSYKKICPHGSFQGMDLCADGTVYVSGGAEGEQPQVYRLHLADGSVVSDELCSITKIYAARTGMENEYITSQSILPEIESFQQFNGRFYVSFNPGSGLKKNNTEIFVLSPAS